MEKQNYGLIKKGEKLWALAEHRNLDISQTPYYTPVEVLEVFEEYSGYIADNPLIDKVLNQKTGEVQEVEKPRAMTVKGFCLYAGLSYSTFRKYSNDIRYKAIINAIKDAIYVQKFEHAAVNLMNAGFIARDLGLADKHEHEVSDKKKEISQLFPEIEDIEAIEIEDTKELPYGDVSTDQSGD